MLGFVDRAPWALALLSLPGCFNPTDEPLGSGSSSGSSDGTSAATTDATTTTTTTTTTTGTTTDPGPTGTGGATTVGGMCRPEDQANPDGTCTATLMAEALPGLLGIVRRVDDGNCLEGVPDDPIGEGDPQWNIQGQFDLLGFDQIRGFLTFDTGTLGAAAFVGGELTVRSNGFTGMTNPVLSGGTQPLFGPMLTALDFDAPAVQIAVADQASVELTGEAVFPIPGPEFNPTGLTQFRISVDATCPPVTEAVWSMHTPSSPGLEPTLEVTYMP